MILTGLCLAGLTTVEFLLLYGHLPPRLKAWMERHPLLADGVASLLTYMLFGGTLVALFAAAWMGLLVSITLTLKNNPSTAALIDYYMGKFDKLKSNFYQWAERYVKQLRNKDNKSQLSIA